MNENICTFHRFARTSESEAWFIQLNFERIGTLNLHLNRNKYFNGDIILTKKIDKLKLDFIIEEVEEKLIGYEFPREDFALYVYKASKPEFYSDTVDHNLSPSTKNDLIEQNNLIQSVLSKYQHTKGQLNEHVAKEYFEKLGYKSVKATPELDALKVDLICENDEKIVFCQVKLGNISDRTIKSIVRSIKDIDSKISKKKVIAIIADSFPINIESIKETLEAEYNNRIWTINKGQILKTLPEYKKALK